MLPFSRRSRSRAEALCDSDIVEVVEPDSDATSSSNSGVVPKAACVAASSSNVAAAPSSVDILIDDDPSIPPPPSVPRLHVVPPPVSSIALPIELASEPLLVTDDVEPPLPSFRATAASLPAYPVEAGSTPALDAAPRSERPDFTPFSDDEEPTRPLGTLPPPPFPRHLGAVAPSHAGEDPPTVRIQELAGSLPPPRSFPPAPGSSLAPVAVESDRRSPTIRVRPMQLDSQDLLLIRGRPSFGWAAALLTLGAVVGIASWEAVQIVRGDDAPPPVAATAPPVVAPPVAKVDEAPKPVAPAIVAEAAKPAVAAAPQAKSAEATKPAEGGRSAASKESEKSASREADKTDAKSKASVPSTAPAPKKVAAVAAVEKPRAAPVKKDPTPAHHAIDSNAEADALARAQLKAALR